MEAWSIIMPPESSMEMPTVDESKIHRKYLDIQYARQSPNPKQNSYHTKSSIIL